jgi:hypothetical protein
VVKKASRKLLRDRIRYMVQKNYKSYPRTEDQGISEQGYPTRDLNQCINNKKTSSHNSNLQTHDRGFDGSTHFDTSHKLSLFHAVRKLAG